MGQVGATLLEYAIALSLLLIVFIAFGKMLEDRSSSSGSSIDESVGRTLPCSGPLTGDACK